MSQQPTSEPKFYGRRHGRALGVARARALKEFLPKVTFDLNAADNPQSQFTSKPKKIWFEIGFGAGEHMIEQAKQNPDIGFIGCEPFMNTVSNCLVNIESQDLKNILIWPDDARLVMDALPDGCLDRVFLLHPDPWPKKRHISRRFIQQETLDSLTRLMPIGSELRIATDAPDLCDWMLEQCQNHPHFEWQAKCANDWRTRPDDWPATRYGEKQLAGTPVYLIFKRI